MPVKRREIAEAECSEDCCAVGREGRIPGRVWPLFPNLSRVPQEPHCCVRGRGIGSGRNSSLDWTLSGQECRPWSSNGHSRRVTSRAGRCAFECQTLRRKRSARGLSIILQFFNSSVGREGSICFKASSLSPYPVFSVEVRRVSFHASTAPEPMIGPAASRAWVPPRFPAKSQTILNAILMW